MDPAISSRTFFDIATCMISASPDDAEGLQELLGSLLTRSGIHVLILYARLSQTAKSWAMDGMKLGYENLQKKCRRDLRDDSRGDWVYGLHVLGLPSFRVEISTPLEF